MKYRQKHIKFCFLHPSASKCSASGPGLEEHGVIVKKPADFTCFMSGSSKGKLNVQVFGPGRKQIDCLVQDNQDNTYSCQYEPIKEGKKTSRLDFLFQNSGFSLNGVKINYKTSNC